MTEEVIEGKSDYNKTDSIGEVVKHLFFSKWKRKINCRLAQNRV